MAESSGARDQFLLSGMKNLDEGLHMYNASVLLACMGAGLKVKYSNEFGPVATIREDRQAWVNLGSRGAPCVRLLTSLVPVQMCYGVMSRGYVIP